MADRISRVALTPENREDPLSMNGSRHHARTGGKDLDPPAAVGAAVATGLTGVLVAVLAFPSTGLKLLGAAVCATVGGAALVAGRHRARPPAGVLAHAAPAATNGTRPGGPTPNTGTDSR
ncbi:hypothetical protein [Saccharothrix obliqua]|uniref:hypothetical protein n=1 Tax=Saccharothrix obliqua TaxID=2861747 RepID=UPI001C5FC78D|nr:hypothetical protein [Saccharothrix obliqua]MBW4721130.1 hypothetical protein [Saccharothrix obliqua]